MKKTLAMLIVLIMTFSAASALAAEENTMPISGTPITLTIWGELGAKAATVLTTWNDMAWVKEFAKTTGVQLDFIHPAVGAEVEQLNTMVAARNLPDLMWTTFTNVPGGAPRLIEEEIILPLNDLIAQYAPNIQKLWEEHPTWKMDAMTDDGDIYMFPEYWGEEANCHFGMVVRDDWAKKVGVALPDTIDEWYIYLKAIREGDPNGNGEADELPYSGIGLDSVKAFQEGFGMRYNELFYLEDGKVVCAVEQDAYKEWLSTMRQWYAEGLIDPEIMSTTRADLDAKVLGDRAGSLWSGAGTGQLGLYLTQKANVGDQNFSLYPVKHILTEDGERVAYYKTVYGLGVALTSECSDPVAAVKLLDYCYSDEGRKMSRLGPEGICYTVKEDGGIAFTDFATQNPEGLAFDSVLIQYGTAPWSFAGVQYPEYWEQNTSFFPQQQAAYPLWSDVTVNKQLPNISFTIEESSVISEYMGDINTMLNESIAKIITGKMEVQEFDDVVATLNKMNLQEVKALYETSLERYYARGK